MSKKEQILKAIPDVMVEFMRKAGLRWDDCFFRYVEFGPGSVGSEWTFRLAGELSHFPSTVDEKLTSKYHTLLEGLVRALFTELAEEGGSRPLVAVASVNRRKKSDVRFDFENNNALQVSSRYLGRELSYFQYDYDAVPTILRFQHGSAVVEKQGNAAVTVANARFAPYASAVDPLVKECIACFPTSWQQGRLTIDCDGIGMNYRLKNATSPDKAQISAALRQLCEDLFFAMRKEPESWIEATLNVTLASDSPSYTIDFLYPNKQPRYTGEIRPWWKFW